MPNVLAPGLSEEVIRQMHRPELEDALDGLLTVEQISHSTDDQLRAKLLKSRETGEKCSLETYLFFACV